MPRPPRRHVAKQGWRTIGGKRFVVPCGNLRKVVDNAWLARQHARADAGAGTV